MDRTDGKLVHLDGVNFSRAWCFYNLARRLLTINGLEVDTVTASRLIKMGDKHIRYDLITSLRLYFFGWKKTNS